ncbi:MAG: hypothetical protein ACRDD7_03365 [Peptostreptococcaceae bacterium]
MKRFLIISACVFVLMLNFMSNIAKNQLVPHDESYFVKSDKKDIYIADGNEWKEFDIVGVNLDPAKPGVYPSENFVKEEEYLRWIQYIYDMGANCIKVPNLMSEHFYNALYKFNENKENPIYLMQGIYFDEVYLKNGYDPQNQKLEEVFKTNIKLVIDSVYGNPYNFDKPDIVQFYNTDVSKYVIGYTLGIEFANHDIIYSEIMNENNAYNGKYLYTDESASSFESYMARMGDYLADYEMEIYKKQSLISFIGSSSYHIVSLRDNPNEESFVDTKNNDKKEDKVKNYLDPENIKSKKKLKTGIVASYNIYPSYSEVKDYQNNMKYYFETINNYHTMPVIIGEYGIPSSRVSGDFNMDVYNKAYINEEEQGRALVDVYESIKESNVAGSFIFEFQDSWYKSAGNTKELKILDRSAYWSDAETFSQSFGLMAFDPGKEKNKIYPDDDISEWSEKNLISKNGNYSLYANNDEKYLYFMLKCKDDMDMNINDIHIDLDITPKSGSKMSSQYNLVFDNYVDFIVNIKDEKYSNIMAHDYYNTSKFLANEKENKTRPDLIKQTKNMDEFYPIFIEVRPRIYTDDEGGFIEKVEHEAGKLVHGNSNPDNKEFNSSADFYIGKNYIELRIPWGLLNFMDPSTKQIQDDFYEELNIKPLKINDIGIGVTIKENDKNVSRLNEVRYDLDSWVFPNYHERLKKSYYIVKDELTS